MATVAFKLTRSPNNYYLWRPKFLEDAAKIDWAIARNLTLATPLGPGHLLEDIDDRYLSVYLSGIGVGSTPHIQKSGLDEKDQSTVASRTVLSVVDKDSLVEKFLNHAPDHGPIDRFKVMIMERMFLDKRRSREIFSLMLDSLDTDAQAAVSGAAAYPAVLQNADVRALWQLISEHHAPDLEMELQRVEMLFQRL